MRKSLIVSAVLAVSTLFAGVASADERGAERPSVQSLRSARNVDAAARTAMKIRQYRERAERPSSIDRVAQHRLEKFRPKGDMVEDKGRTPRVAERAARPIDARGSKMIQNKVRPRGDVESGGSNHTFTLANDRKGRYEHSGPRTIVDVMKRKELLKFIGATGVKVNCKQTGTCTESPI
jgi:hypothetical protein